MRALTVKVKKNIKNCFKAGDMLVRVNGCDFWRCNDQVYPSVFDISNRDYFETPKMMDIPKYPMEQLVLFRLNDNDSMNAGVIKEFDPETARYKIKSVANLTDQYIERSEEEIIPTEEYWYINQKGNVYMQYLHCNKEQDEWLEAAGLIFNSRNGAIEYRDGLIEKLRKDKASF